MTDETEIAVCSNCVWRGPSSECGPVSDLLERVGPGETMPAGECPECGCLAHLLEEEEPAKVPPHPPVIHDGWHFNAETREIRIGKARQRAGLEMICVGAEDDGPRRDQWTATSQ